MAQKAANLKRRKAKQKRAKQKSDDRWAAGSKNGKHGGLRR
jgi:hypothetical protein